MGEGQEEPNPLVLSLSTSVRYAHLHLPVGADRPVFPLDYVSMEFLVIKFF